MTDRQKKKMLKVRGILEEVFYCGKMHGLSLVEADILMDCYNQIARSEKHETETFNSGVAAIFRKAKFHVVDPHDCEVNYIISL